MTEDRRQYAIRMRTEAGLRADPAWVDHVAATGRDGGMTLNIPLTDDELADLHARYERSIAVGAAVREAALPSAAGMWIERPFVGPVHVLLAHPDPAEQATAEAIIAGGPAVIDLVEHSTRDLEHVALLVDHARRSDPDFAATIVSYGPWLSRGPRRRGGRRSRSLAWGCVCSAGRARRDLDALERRGVTCACSSRCGATPTTSATSPAENG